ncbi:MAG: flavodoxin family protein [Thermotogota bacterium]
MEEIRHLCISTSNVNHKKNDSASTKTCEIIKDLVEDKENKVNIIKLVEHKLKPCKFCGSCVKDGKCIKKDDFNDIFSKMKKADIIYFVVPHYSIIPAKMTMIFEKINELLYTSWIKDPNFNWVLKDKKAFIIAHGGTNIEEMPEAEKLYEKNIIEPMKFLLKSFGMNVLKNGDTDGYIFGVEKMKEKNKALFPDMIHDWDKIKKDLKEILS